MVRGERNGPNDITSQPESTVPLSLSPYAPKHYSAHSHLTAPHTIIASLPHFLSPAVYITSSLMEVFPVASRAFIGRAPRGGAARCWPSAYLAACATCLLPAYLNAWQASEW
jgi:hypothetical protein